MTRPAQGGAGSVAAALGTEYTSSLVSVSGAYHSSYTGTNVTSKVLVSLSSIIVIALPMGVRRPNYMFAVATGGFP